MSQSNQPVATSNPVPTCQHIKANGLRCGSPAMQHGAFCFFHTDVRLRRKHKRIPLPILEDANSVQMALNQLAARIMEDGADLKKTGQLLYLLQISAQNVLKTRFEQMFADVRRCLARDYTPAMEAELQAVPGVVKTPAAVADLEEMYRARDQWIKEKEAANQPAVIGPESPGKKSVATVSDRRHLGDSSRERDRRPYEERAAETASVTGP